MGDYYSTYHLTMKINPYLTFDGDAEEAFNFYRSLFNCPAPSTVMRFKDAPADMIKLPPGAEEKIMHIAMPLGDGSFLMASDTWDAPEHPFKPGNNFHVAIQADSEEEAQRLFSGLSAGGEVKMPLEKQFWGSLFGILVDKFGIQWMVDLDL